MTYYSVLLICYYAVAVMDWYCSMTQLY